RPTSFCLAAEPLYGTPPVGGTFWFQIFIQAPSPEIWSETISGSEEGPGGGNWGACFWATSFGKNIGGMIALISFRLTWDGCRSLLPFGGVLSFRSEAREVLGSEAARVHHAARWRGSRVAARGARGADDDADGRISEQSGAERSRPRHSRLPTRPQRG